jgi:hypothetical protein
VRDNAFAALGDANLVNRRIKGAPPAFKIESVQELAACGADGCQAGENDLLARRVSGSVTVACFLDKPGCPPGSKFRYRKRTGRYGFAFFPVRSKGNSITLPFTCIVPRVALTKKARPVLYGHQMFGGPNDVLDPAVQALAQEHAFVLCSVRQTGFSDQDNELFNNVLRNASRFPQYADRLQQGLVGTLMMGRLMLHPKGLGSHPAFQFSSTGTSLLDGQKLYFDTTGLGGNFGTALTALAPDFDRAVLGSAGMRFSLMMDRSTTLAPYAALLAKAYPDRVTRNIVLAMIQGLWDRAEANGYAARVTGDPPPNTPIHDVLLQLSVGDHAIPPLSSEILARTAEMTVRAPAFDNGRSPDRIPFFGITETGQLELESTTTVWDGGPMRAGGLGTPPAPVENLPPAAGTNPHGLVQQTPAARQQISTFLLPLGKLLDVCPVRKACRVAGYPY